MYGSHYSGPPGQQNSGPSQPEWRLPASTQPQQQQPPPPSWRPSTVSPPPPASTAPPYHANTYGAASGPPSGSAISPSVSPLPGFTPSLDTSSWGVRYNYQQPPPHVHSPPPPPLPPRPSSTTGHSYPTTQPPAMSPVDTTRPLPPPPPPLPGYGPPPSVSVSQNQWMSNAPYTSQPPPPPPPIPQGYANTLSQPVTQPFQQPPPPSYSDTMTSQPVGPHQVNHPQNNLPPPPTTSPPPQPPRPQPVTTTSATSTLSTGAPPVPPKMSPLIVPTGPSALGTGGPSDWEHLSPTPGDIDDVAAFEPRPGYGHSRNYSELPTNAPTAPPESMSISPTTISTPTSNVSPQAHYVHMRDNGPLPNQSKQSPVSLRTSQELHNPPPPARVDTAESTYTTASGTGASESIDKVIEAWKRPVSSDGKSPVDQGLDPGANTEPEPSTPLQGPSPLDVSKPKSESPVPQNPNKPTEEVSKPAPVSSDAAKKVDDHPKPPDPFEDLDPWFRSSLERYIAMLRKESVVDSDEERFKIFTAFMAKETKLREILYNISHESPKIEGPATIQPTSTTEIPEPKAKEPLKISTPDESGLIPVDTENEGNSTNGQEDTEDGRYSPGGRPILPRLHTPVSAVGLRRSASLAVGSRFNQDHPGQSQFSRPISVPPTMNETIRRQSLSPLTTNPPHAIYTPFRYAEGPQRGSDNLMFDRPAYQAYSALRQASAESGRMMANVPVLAPTERPSSVAPSATPNETDETFIGLIREKSVAYRKKESRRVSSPPPPLPISLRQGRPVGAIDELRSMVSSPLAKQSESSWHVTTNQGLEKHSNDFGYIREATVSWETANKIEREKLDKLRMQRQEESEEHIDELFNEKEIGYADINVLEEEFRQKEARAQLAEEREDVEDFVKKVFKPTEKRLTEEISALHDLYESALSQLNHENSRIKDSERDKYNLSHTMKIVNDIYRKLELRYQKRLEIALDLERRRKKAERRPLVFMGDSAALRKVDAEFDQMEKQNILRAARDRDERANRLMDSFDEAIIHGLGENQSLLDESLNKVSKIDLAAIRSSGMTDSEVEQMFKSVQYSVDSLRQDSETILHYFGLADAALNEADYQVSVAEARCSGADAEVFDRLDEEKKKEDDKIQNELKSKIASVRAAPTKIIATMNDLLKCLGKEPSLEEPTQPEPLPENHPVDALLPGPRPPTANASSKKPEEDPEHQERLRRALENAKKRNAARSNPGA